MKFNVPQFIDIEDKIAFQLTAKQLGWFALGGVILFFIWKFFEQEVFLVWFILIPLICAAFAFYRPYGISLVTFIFYGIMFLFFPKRMIWKKVEIRMIEKKNRSKKKNPSLQGVRRKDLSQIEELAKSLDNTLNFK